MDTLAIPRIPQEELAELWFGFKQQLLGKLQQAYRTGGLRQIDIAARWGRDPATVNRCLRGEQNMTIQTMHDLARSMDYRLRIELERLDHVRPTNRARRPREEKLLVKNPSSEISTDKSSTVRIVPEVVDGR
jgi:hypothetical protein